MPHEGLQGPWEKLGADFSGFESTNYLLIANYYSHIPVIRRMRSTISNATIDAMKQVFSEYCVPQIVMSDRGPKISSTEPTLQHLQTNTAFTTSYKALGIHREMI